MRADRPDHFISKATKEVTMFKRVTIVTLVVAAFLVLAVPALAFQRHARRLHDSGRVSDLPFGHRGHPQRVSDWPRRSITRDAEADSAAAVSSVRLQLRRLPYVELRSDRVTPVPTATSSDRRRLLGGITVGDDLAADPGRSPVLGELHRLLVVPLRREHGRHRRALGHRRERYGAHGAVWRDG